jgi:hypothetical protein
MGDIFLYIEKISKKIFFSKLLGQESPNLSGSISKSYRFKFVKIIVQWYGEATVGDEFLHRYI